MLLKPGLVTLECGRVIVSGVNFLLLQIVPKLVVSHDECVLGASVADAVRVIVVLGRCSD